MSPGLSLDHPVSRNIVNGDAKEFALFQVLQAFSQPDEGEGHPPSHGSEMDPSNRKLSSHPCQANQHGANLHIVLCHCPRIGSDNPGLPIGTTVIGMQIQEEC